MGRGDQVRLLVNHKDQGGKQARLRRTEHSTEFGPFLKRLGHEMKAHQIESVLCVLEPLVFNFLE